MEVVILSYIVGLWAAIIVFFVYKYTYWKRKNVPSPSIVPLLGNYASYITLKKTQGEAAADIYNQFPDAPYVGAYIGTEPVLIPKDPEMIKIIMAKDFHAFSGRFLVEHEYRDPLSSSDLFSTSGDNWKVMRQNMNPLFTVGKLKSFFDFINECGDKLDKYLEDVTRQSEVVDAKDMATKYILEVIGSMFFGLKFDVLKPGSQSLKIIADSFETNTNLKFWMITMRIIWPNIYYMLSRKTIYSDDFQKKLFELANESFASRDNKPSGRNDFIDYLLKFLEKGYIEGNGLKSDKKVQIPVNEQVLVAQIFVVFIAGYHTSSNATSFTLYELAKKRVIQDRLLIEIDDILRENNGKITYESLHQYKYLDQCISETLRKYPILGVITREVTVPYTFEDYGLKVEKGLRIHIPAWAIHRDPKYYPDPEIWDPERYSPVNKAKRHQYTDLSFGEGQRICIGLKLAKIQVAAGLIRILSKYRVETCKETRDKIEFDPRQFGLMANHPIFVKMIRRSSS